jgi:nickel transport protein
MKLLALAAALAVLSVPGAAGAHGVEAEVERSGAGIAVRARFHGGAPLAGASYEVLSPDHPERPHAAGRTDRHGWVAFVANAPGTWRIRIADASGHGRLVEVEVAPADLAVAHPAAEPRPSTSAPRRGPEAQSERGEGYPETLRAPHARGGRDSGEAVTGGERSSSPTPRMPDEGAPGATPLRIALGALAILVLFGAVFAVQRRRHRGAR